MKRNLHSLRGMTLFEILVVISVLSIISLMMFRIMVVNSRENRRLLSRVERVQVLRLAMESLLRDIESAVPYLLDGKAAFQVEDGQEGSVDSDRITLVVPFRRDDGSISVVERTYYLQRELRDGQVVWSMAWAQDMAVDGEVKQMRGHVVTPLTGMQSISFDVEVSSPGDNSWRNAWQPGVELPEKVRIHLRAVDPGDPDHPVETAETVYLMAG